MPFLTIAGIEVDVVDFREIEPIRLSPKTRSWDGTLRGTVRGTIRRWSGTLREMTKTDYEALLTATVAEKEVAVAGDALPSTRQCVVRVGGAQYVNTGTGFVLVAPVEIESIAPEA